MGLVRRTLMIRKLFNVSVSTFWLRHFYLENKIKCLQPKWTYPSAWKNAEEIARTRLNFCLNLSKILLQAAPCCFVDETTVNLWMKGMKVWTHAAKSERVTLPLTSSRGKSLTIYGSVSLATSPMFFAEKGTCTNAEEFCLYLEKLRKVVLPQYKNRIVHLVIDNHKAHKTKEVLDKMKELKFKPLMLPVASCIFNTCE